MAFYGLRKPFVASYDKDSDSYSNGFQCGKAIGVSVTPNYVEGSLYADDEQDEYEKAFQNANVTLNTNTLPVQAANTMYGHEIDEEKGEIIYKTTDESNYVGVGFVVAQTVSGKKSFVATIITCVKFTEAAEEFSTKGESITYVTPSQEGLAIADANSKWKVKETFDTADEAIAFIKNYLNIPVIASPTVAAESQLSTLFNTAVSDIQGSDVTVTDNAIVGTLKYLDSGDIADYWGAGNFVALKFSDIPNTATSVKVGLEPSAGSGLVEIIDDPDKNGVFKITDKDAQKFRVVITDGTYTTTKDYSLSGLTLETA